MDESTEATSKLLPDILSRGFGGSGYINYCINKMSEEKRQQMIKIAGSVVVGFEYVPEKALKSP